MNPVYDWPELDGLVAFVKKNGVAGAARKLGVAQSTLSHHLSRNGLLPTDYSPEPKKLNQDALQEIRDLIK